MCVCNVAIATTSTSAEVIYCQDDENSFIKITGHYSTLLLY